MSKKSCFNKIKNFQEFFKQHDALAVLATAPNQLRPAHAHKMAITK